MKIADSKQNRNPAQISLKRVTKDAAHAGADQRDLLAAANRIFVNVQLLGQASFVERRAECFDHRIGVLLEEELAVTEHATGVIDQPDQFGFLTEYLASMQSICDNPL